MNGHSETENLQRVSGSRQEPVVIPPRFENNRQASAWMIRMGRALLRSNVPISRYISRSDNDNNFEVGFELIAIGRRIAMGYQMKNFTPEIYKAHVNATRPSKAV